MEQTSFPLPPNLPRPVDDGAANHLKGMQMPRVSLPSTRGRSVDLGNLRAPRTIIYCYPMTGVPGRALPDGWDEIPGARGCTPQTCGFRDQYQELMRMGVELFGMSTQTTEYQREMAERLYLPFEILSDASFSFCDSLRLPTFEVDGMRLMKRLTLVVHDQRVEHVLYPVFPANESADQIIRWIDENPLP